MKSKNTSKILKEACIDYCIGISYIRVLLLPVLFTLFFASYLEIYSAKIVGSIIADIKSGNSVINNTVKYIAYSTAAIFLAEICEIVFSGPVQYLYKHVGVEAFKYYISLDIDEFNKVGCGEIQMIIERKSRAYGDIIEITVINLLPVLITLTIAFSAVFKELGYASFFVTFASVILYIWVTVMISHWRYKIRKDYNRAMDRSYNVVQDNLSNIETIVAYNKQSDAVIEFDSSQADVENQNKRLFRYYYVMMYLQKLTFCIQAGTIIFIGLFGLFSEKMSPQNLIFSIMIGKKLSNDLGNLGALYSRYTHSIANAKSGEVYKPKREDTKIPKNDFLSSIKARNLEFNLLNKHIFNSASFDILKGEKIAILGGNGSGKSTLLKLLLRLHKFEGSVMIDNIEIDRIQESSYRNIFSYATQHSFLFNDTVTYNIQFGNENLDSNGVLKICKELNIHDAIQKLPDGYNTIVGEGGKRLSGGERQKILLARTLVKEADILLFDEPTSALDKKSEKQLMSFIFAKYSEKTILMILHNLELLFLFDKIFLIKDKKVYTIENVQERMKNPAFIGSLSRL